MNAFMSYLVGLLFFLFLLHTLAKARFDYFEVVETWPTTFCMTERCVKTPNRFTIHGLWPLDYYGRQPSDCRVEEFDEDQVLFPLSKLTMMIYRCLASMIFRGYILFDTDNLIKRFSYDEYIWATVSLYLDIINLCLSLLTVFRAAN